MIKKVHFSGGRVRTHQIDVQYLLFFYHWHGREGGPGPTKQLLIQEGVAKYIDLIPDIILF